MTVSAPPSRDQTRAVFFSASALTTFGSLWLSHHPGTSSVGKLMALTLATTLSAAVLSQLALLAARKLSNYAASF